MDFTINSDIFLTIIFSCIAFSFLLGGALEYSLKGGHADTKEALRLERKENEKLREIIYDFSKHPSVRPARTAPSTYTTSRRLSAVKN